MLYGSENAIDIIKQTVKNTTKRMDIVLGYRELSILLQILQFYKRYDETNNSGIKIRCITEITPHNVEEIKKIIPNLGMELRHLAGISEGIIINETEYFLANSFDTSSESTEISYGNSLEMVKHGHNMFETLWINAVPSVERINQLKQQQDRSLMIETETKILVKTKDLASSMEKELSCVLKSSNEFNLCTTTGGLKVTYNYFLSIFRELIEKKEKQLHKGIKVLIEINKDNFELVKEFLKLGVEVRHYKDIPSINFGLTDTHVIATIEGMKDGNFADSMLYSTDHAYLKHFKELFERLWKNSYSPFRIIKSLEENEESHFIKTIEEAKTTIDLIKSMIYSSEQEILGILPSFESLCRQVQLGIFDYLKDLQIKKDKKISIKILVTDTIDKNRQTQINRLFGRSLKLVKKQSYYTLKDEKINNFKSIKQEEFTIKSLIDFSLRTLPTSIPSEMGLIVIDKNKSMIIESKNNNSHVLLKNDGFSARPLDYIGLASYSNSNQISKSYALIFDNLWNQSMLYLSLKSSYNILESYNKMQLQFIDIVAHELRTPIQPILGLATYLNDKIEDKNYKELLQVIIESTTKLHELAERILDVTKIQDNNLKISKENFSINSLILNIVKQYQTELDNKNNRNNIHVGDMKNIKFELSGFNEDHIIHADKNRIKQVISNLISNSINFILTPKDGSISINIIKDQVNNQIIIQIKDNGDGIHPEIFTKLFTKFMTRSFYGAGLGLYVCKHILLLHNGDIWAENNKDQKGATFSFSLPVIS